MSDLVERLTEGEHEVAAIRYDTLAQLQEAIERGVVIVRFTQTSGETELTMRLLETPQGASGGQPVRLRGALNLDYVPVECVVSLDPQTLKGSGKLVRAEQAA